jgi:hypothetical protein
VILIYLSISCELDIAEHKISTKFTILNPLGNLFDDMLHQLNLGPLHLYDSFLHLQQPTKFLWEHVAFKIEMG